MPVFDSCVVMDVCISIFLTPPSHQVFLLKETQLAFTCSKSTIETPEYMKSVQN